MKLSRAASAAIVLGVTVVLISTTLAPASAPRTAKPKADDIGITDTEIRLAIIADVENPIVPGLFQGAVDAVRAWAKLVNKEGGIAGRKVVIDFIDSELSADKARNGVIKACSDDFAMIGTQALFLNNVDDGIACPDARGNPVGLPDMPGIAFEVAQRCSPVTYTYSGDTKFCATKDENPQTYYPQRGDFRYYLKKVKDLHGVFTIPSDLKSATDSVKPLVEAGVDLGIKKDGEGFFLVSASSPQSALTPIIQAAKDAESNFVYNSSSFSLMVLLRREAKLQGLDSVKIWACNQGCYDNEMIKQGGADVEGNYSILTTLPFYSEYKQNPSLKALVRELGGIDNLTSNSINAYVAALLFQEAAEKAVADGGTLTRQSLLDALASIDDFDAQGILGPTDVGNHEPSRCIVMTQVKNGKWVRAFPKKVGTFDCSEENIGELKLDQTS